jgi:hypothetical protein
MHEGGKCIRKAWLWRQCMQSNAARLHPVGLVHPETRTKRTPSCRYGSAWAAASFQLAASAAQHGLRYGRRQVAAWTPRHPTSSSFQLGVASRLTSWSRRPAGRTHTALVCLPLLIFPGKRRIWADRPLCPRHPFCSDAAASLSLPCRNCLYQIPCGRLLSVVTPQHCRWDGSW